MTIETMDKAVSGRSTFDVQSRLGELHEAFDIEEDQFTNIDNHVISDDVIRQAFEIGEAEITDEIRQAALDAVREIFEGKEVGDHTSLGLNEIGNWKKNEMCIEQQAGNAAEVISTVKENLSARLNGTGEVTYRTNDVPADVRKKLGDILDSNNEHYVDKVRVKTEGSCERVHTAFVGKDSEGCAQRLMSKAYDKVIKSGKVDKIEVPNEYYDELKQLIPKEYDFLLEQYDRVCAEGKTDAAENLLKRIDSLTKLSDMIEPSIVKKAEAVYSVIQMLDDPEFQQCIEETYSELLESGSENYKLYQQGEISLGGALLDTVLDVTGEAANGVVDIKEGTALAEAAEAVSNTIDDFHDYQNGEINGGEFFYNMLENAAGAVGAFAGEAVSESAAGKIIGSIAGIETKEEWIEKGEEIAVNSYETVVETVQEVGETVIEAANEVKETISDAADAVSEKMEDIGEAASDIADSVGETAGEAMDKAAEIADAAKAKIFSIFD